MTSPNWLSLAASVPDSERAKMLAKTDAVMAQATDTVAAVDERWE